MHDYAMMPGKFLSGLRLGPGLGDAKQEATEAKDLGKTFGFVVHDSFKVVCESREARRGF